MGGLQPPCVPPANISDDGREGARERWLRSGRRGEEGVNQVRVVKGINTRIGMNRSALALGKTGGGEKKGEGEKYYGRHLE